MNPWYLFVAALFICLCRTEGSQDEDWESYLVDRSGNEYEPYSLAWRYLGAYIDCDVEEHVNDDDGGYDGYEAGGIDRRLSGGSNDNDDGSVCQRVILWAAYRDPRYSGNQIGEYQFYDLDTGKWDSQYCKAKRCVRMDCHERHTHFKLVGVFKETDGLYDWAEQLFKHQGYCVWDSDQYSFMQNLLESWPSYCLQLRYPDDYGNTLYLDMLPQAEGNMTWGIFEDEYCLTQSSTTSFSDYVYIFYSNYYGDGDYAYEQQSYWNYTLETWNEYLNTYKICQPCRAYNLHKYDYDDENQGRRNRFLGEENDGEGDAEMWGYDCYDDAGYTNCNQCYKFETKTDLEPADASDLRRASQQGSILRIKYRGRWYGKGGYTSPRDWSVLGIVGMIFGGAIIIAAMSYFALRTKCGCANNDLPPSFKESLAGDDVAGDDQDGEPKGIHAETKKFFSALIAARMTWFPSWNKKHTSDKELPPIFDETLDGDDKPKEIS